MVLSEQKLVDTLQDKCINAKKRIWIASPFISDFSGIQKIFSNVWNTIDRKILTDIEFGFIRRSTFNKFNSFGAEIRSLESLHAKIYIIDDWCLITSANLTNTAFTSRYEIGISADDIAIVDDVVKTFDKWWKMALPVSSLPQKMPIPMDVKQYHDGKGFTKKFRISSYSNQILSSKVDNYGAKCQKYIEFAKCYEKVTGRNQKMVADGYTLLQEVDYFFNYLYHEHKQKPSYKVQNAKNLTHTERDAAIRRHFNEMSAFYIEDPQLWRLDRSKTIQNLLNPKKIQNLNWNEVKKVVESLHCLHSYSIIKTKFLNPNNNKLEDIKKNWNKLLNGGNITTTKISEVIKNLRSFGPSSAQELIGWYYPDTYPMMNTNSDCGMRYFGYKV